eukprot:10235737-Alexandrium_andersonii.AAC.1
MGAGRPRHIWPQSNAARRRTARPQRVRPTVGDWAAPSNQDIPDQEHPYQKLRYQGLRYQRL